MSDEPTLPFGKFKGQKMSEIQTHYLDWLLGQDWLRPELREEVTAELNKRPDWHAMDRED